MSSVKTQWVLELIDRITAPVQNIQVKTSNLGKAIAIVGAMNFHAVGQSAMQLNDQITQLNQPFISFDAQLKEVEAITGVTGQQLKDLGNNARQTALIFGGDASAQVEAYKKVLSRLGPELANKPKALDMIGNNIQTLSKTMSGDAIGATDALTTSMLQFQVDLDDTNAIMRESTRMMNVMAAGAKYGAAEVPQISASLEQAGVQANLTKLTFEETNAALQALAEGGKYGSEAGVALRNVLTNMHAPDALSKEAVNNLKKYHINLKQISDTSKPFSERLAALAPIQNDLNALTSVFGKENAANAQILIRSAESQAELTQKITGTNTAVEQADIIMGSWQERLNRLQAKLTDTAISIGEYTAPLQPAVSFTAQLAMTGSSLASIYSGLASIFTATKTAQTAQTTTTATATVATGGLATATTATATAQGVATGTTYTLTGAIKAMSTAIMSIPLIGWILAAISAVIAIFTYLYNNSEKFRGIVWGVWEVIKMVFGKIWEFVEPIIVGIWNMIKAYFTTMWNFWKTIFTWIWDTVKSVFLWIHTTIVGTILKVWNFIKGALNTILNTFKWAFGGVYNYIAGIFQKIYDKIKVYIDAIGKVVGGIKDFFSDIFGSVKETVGKVTTEVVTTYKEGEAKGKKNFRDEKEKEKKENGFDLLGNSTTTDFLSGKNSPSGKNGTVAGTLQEDKKDEGTKMTGSGGIKNITQNIEIKNNFSVSNDMDIRSVAEKVARIVNDNLSDGLALA